MSENKQPSLRSEVLSILAELSSLSEEVTKLIADRLRYLLNKYLKREGLVTTKLPSVPRSFERRCPKASEQRRELRSCKANCLWSTSSWWQKPGGSNCRGCTRTWGAACKARAGGLCQAGTGREAGAAGSRPPSGSPGATCVCSPVGA